MSLQCHRSRRGPAGRRKEAEVHHSRYKALSNCPPMKIGGGIRYVLAFRAVEPDRLFLVGLVCLDSFSLMLEYDETMNTLQKVQVLNFIYIYMVGG